LPLCTYGEQARPSGGFVDRDATRNGIRPAMTSTPTFPESTSDVAADEGRRRDEQLRDLQAITDATLSRLSPDDLLTALLQRITKIVDADTTTVLLLDPDAGVLVARASLGLEEEVRQGVRIPVGVGFAGRIAATRRPVAIDRVYATTVTNPILWEHDVKVMLGVPLLEGGETVGVLHVGRCRPVPFTSEDADILSIAAERMAAAIQTEQRRHAQAAAALLIDNLRPGPPPQCPGLSFAARYLPAERGGAGGDWYDGFLTESGHLWVIMGDVVGHGTSAAVMMGRAQTTLRAFASSVDAPEAALEQANRFLTRFHPGIMVTALAAVLAPPYREMCIATAGHPPPVIVQPGERAEVMALTPEPPLGIFPHVVRSARTVAFPTGATALFYTDGLIERREEPLETSMERLCDCVWAEDAETVCRRALRSMVGRQTLHDDVALLAMHATAS
jgi:sigma-B regulation protein RsbU (phosphoserine phosphatase)